MKLCDFCIKRPAFTIVLSLLIMAIGLICYQKLPVRYLPKITVPVISVNTDYPGASSHLVEMQVTNILEDAMSGLPGLKFMTSSSKNGNSQITLTFKIGANIDNAAQDVRENVAKVVAQLPGDAKPPVVSKTNPNAQPILFLAYFNSNESIGALTNYVEQFIVPQFNASSGVAKVDVWSSDNDSLRIDLNPEKMAARGITVDDIKPILKNENVDVPAGEITGNQLSYTVTASLSLHRPQAFSDLIIKNEDNHIVRLKDIATVVVRASHRTSDTSVHYFSVNGKPGVAIGLIPEAGGNDLTMTDNALILAHHIAVHLPDGMKQIVEYNQSDFTKTALHSVFEAIFEAFLLVLLVVLLFLGNIRAAFIPVVTIPICLIGSFFVVYFLGYTINSITLMALVLAIGLVVDDAIIMLENIVRFIEQGDAAQEAAFKGSKQIAFPVIAMTIVLAGVYLPVGFTGGISGVFFKEFAYTLLGAILISGFIALTLSPMLCAKILTASSHSAYIEKLERFFHRLQSHYKNFLLYIFNKLKWITVGIFLLIITGFGLFYLLPSELAPSMNMPMINLWVQTADQDSFSKTQSFIPQFETVLNQTPAVEDYLMQNWERGDFYASIVLKPSEIKHSHQIAAQLQKQLDNIPGTLVTVNVAPPPLTWFVPTSQPGFIEMNVLTNNSYVQLHQMMRGLLKSVKESNQFINPTTALRWDTRQINIHVNRDLVADLHIPMSSITTTLQVMLGGMEIGQYDFGNQSFDVIMGLSNKNLKTMDILNQLYVRNLKQQLIPLQNVIRFTKQNLPGELNHYNRLRADTINAKLAPGVSMNEAINTLQKLAKQTLPSNTAIAFSGSAEQYLESSHTMACLFFLALVFVYLILVAQFESFIDPVIILTCVPFALVGGLFALWLTGNSLNLYSDIGLVTLIGLIAKHGILITEFANKKMAEGFDAIDAITQAAALRLRPILMTTASMVLGALPLALAIGPASEDLQQIGWVVVGGLLWGTLISLVVVPAAYITVKRVI